MNVPSEVVYTLIGVALAGAVWTALRLMGWWSEVKKVEENLRAFGHELYEASNATMESVKAFHVDAEKMEKSADAMVSAVTKSAMAQVAAAAAVNDLNKTVGRLAELIAASGGAKNDLVEHSEVDKYRISLVNEAVNQGMSRDEAEVYAVEAMTHNIVSSGL